MVGCGGFGAANAGAATMVSAAAKEPAIVVLAMMVFELIGNILPHIRPRDRRRQHGLRYRVAGEAGEGRATRMQVLRTPRSLSYHRTIHETVTWKSLL